MAARCTARHRKPARPGSGNGGFTLVELMIGLLVLSVLLAIGAPAFINLIKDNRLLSEVYALRASLNRARSEALAQRTFVIVCRSSDLSACDTGNWNAGYIAFTDEDGTGNPADPNQIFITHTPPEKLTVTYTDTIPTAESDRIRFNSRGYVMAYDGTLTICDDRGNPEARGVIVASTGIVRAALVDPNDPGADTLASCP